jgi:hypothetical protein
VNRERPIITARRRFLEHEEQLARLGLAERFSFIFEGNLWADPESKSGPGSSLDATRALRSALAPLLRSLGVKVLLDAPCGDFSWMRELDLAGIRYEGVDIVPRLVEINAEKFGGAARRFTLCDITRATPPAADFALCRDCLVHLRFANIASALGHFRRAGVQFLAVTHFLEVSENADIADGDWRPLNFERPPFNFPPPDHVLDEACEEGGGAYRDKTLAVWRMERIPPVNVAG